MSSDPKECREFAYRCLELARDAKEKKLKEHLLSLAETWIKIAMELERSRAGSGHS